MCLCNLWSSNRDLLGDGFRVRFDVHLYIVAVVHAVVFKINLGDGFCKGVFIVRNERHIGHLEFVLGPFR